jgi:alkylation response protein AidB-like acyl-CoA dehydrogenase
VRDGDGWKLYGEKCLVPLAESAELLLVAVEVRGVGPRVFLVPKGTPNVTITPEPAMGARAAATARVTLDGAPVGRDAMLGGDDDGAIDLAALVARARVAWAALAVGTGQAVLDFVKTYVNERHAFGEPISHRQAVAFAVADIAIELEGVRLLTWRAAALADRADDARFVHAATLARTQAAQKAMKIGSDGVQLLGGHGFVKEFPVERWYRDLRAIGVMEGALLV